MKKFIKVEVPHLTSEFVKQILSIYLLCAHLFCANLLECATSSSEILLCYYKVSKLKCSGGYVKKADGILDGRLFNFCHLDIFYEVSHVKEVVVFRDAGGAAGVTACHLTAADCFFAVKVG